MDDTTATKRQRLASKAIEGELPSAEAGDPSFEDTSAAGALVLDVAGSVLETAVEEVAAVARLRGLPWSHSAGEVCDFLGTIGLKVQPEAVTMLHNAAGEAFITLERQDQMAEVLKANRQQIGKRYVECFESSAASAASSASLTPCASRPAGSIVARRKSRSDPASVASLSGVGEMPRWRATAARSCCPTRRAVDMGSARMARE